MQVSVFSTKLSTQFLNRRIINILAYRDWQGYDCADLINIIRMCKFDFCLKRIHLGIWNWYNVNELNNLESRRFQST